MVYFSETAATPSYRLLSEEQIRTIHAATLEILETVGVRVLNNEGLRLLQDAAAASRTATSP
jgi:trimethylamine:corrinoid methyltransferase-like protein